MHAKQRIASGENTGDNQVNIGLLGPQCNRLACGKHIYPAQAVWRNVIDILQLNLWLGKRLQDGQSCN